MPRPSLNQELISATDLARLENGVILNLLNVARVLKYKSDEPELPADNGPLPAWGDHCLLDAISRGGFNDETCIYLD